MALDALLVAIPAALIAILIEKLVSMIVPAAGALMAIIEGLQAAWGTISRIVAAFAAFMAFLLAVKSGSAGALFAAVLAGAAVVVLDFVASWLLKKLASATRKVGAKLKGLAEKFKAKRKAKTEARAGKHHDEQAGKKPHEHDEKDRKSPAERRKEEVQKRVEKAERELPPKIRQFMSRRRSKLRLRMQLLGWRVLYRLSKLELIDSPGKQLTLHAQVNPPVNLGPEGVVWSIEWREVLEVFDEVAGAAIGQPTDSLDMRERAVGTGASLRREGTYKFGSDSSGQEAEFDVTRKTSGWPPYLRNKVNEVRSPRASSGSLYPEITSALGEVPPEQLGAYLKAAYQNPKGPLPDLPDAARKHANELFGIWHFEPGHPRLRQETADGKTELVPTFQHRRDHAYGMMTADLLARGDIGVEQAIAGHPAQGGGAQKGARAVTLSDLHGAPAPQESHKDNKAYQVRRDKELALIKAWLHSHCAGPNAPLWSSAPSKPVLAAFVKAKIDEFLHTGAK